MVPKGDLSTTTVAGVTHKNMWRWQSVQEFQYPLIEYFNAYKNLPLFLGIETVVPGHEHTSMSVITGQIPAELETVRGLLVNTNAAGGDTRARHTLPLRRFPSLLPKMGQTLLPDAISAPAQTESLPRMPN